MRIALLAFSDRGMELGGRIEQALTADTGANNYAREEDVNTVTVERCGKGELAAWTDRCFDSADALVFVGACGIAVRAIAPHVEHKTSDPAVVVVDELGRFSISLLSGHIGGANALASAIARITGGTPVITTATDINGVFAVDTWAKSRGLKIANPEQIVQVSSALLANRPVRLINEFFTLGALPNNISFAGGNPAIHISYRTSVLPGALQLVPPVVTLGVGCRKGVTEQAINDAVAAALNEAQIRLDGVCGVASIDLKAQEPGLVAWCEHHRLPLATFSAEELAAAPGQFTPSKFVESTVGVDNVCERSAVLASKGHLVAPKFALNGVTVACAEAPYSISFKEDR